MKSMRTMSHNALRWVHCALLCRQPDAIFAGELQVHRLLGGPGTSGRLRGRWPVAGNLRVQHLNPGTPCQGVPTHPWQSLLKAPQRDPADFCLDPFSDTALNMNPALSPHPDPVLRAASQVPRQLFRSSSFATVVAGELGMFGFPPEVRLFPVRLPSSQWLSKH